MARLRTGRRRAIEELRELFWEWDPLGLGPERDLLPREYDAAVVRTLELLEQDADRDALEDHLSEWLSRIMATPPIDGPDLDLQTAATRLEGWWQEFVARPPEAPERYDFWATPLLGLTRAVWLFGGVALAIAVGRLIPIVVGEESPDSVLRLWVSFWGAVMLPAAALLGVPRLPRTNPQLWTGTVLIGAAQLASMLTVLERLLGPALGLDPFADPAPIRAYYVLVNALGTGLLVAGLLLFHRGLRSVGAPPTRWVRPVVVVSVALAAVSLLLPLVAYGQLYVDALASAVPASTIGLLLGVAELIAIGAVVASLASGVRAKLDPRAAWVLGTAGFGVWFIQVSTIGLILTLTQAVPDVASVSGPLLVILGNVRLPAVVGALVLGLGGGGEMPPWMVALRSWWARQRRTLTPAAPSS